MAVPATQLARACAAVVSLTALLSLSLQAADLIQRQGYEPMAAIWRMSRFFTILTNGLVVLTMGAIALNSARPRTLWLLSLTLSMGMVCVVYWRLLAGIHDPEGLGVLANLGLHAVVPALMIGWWILFAPKARLRLDHVPGFATWPFIYCAYALTRGEFEGIYPYPFLDPSALGWSEVFKNMVELGLAFMAVGLVVVWITRAMNRQTQSP